MLPKRRYVTCYRRLSVSNNKHRRFIRRLKYEGRPLYYYARRGIDVPRKTRTIHIHQIDFIALKGDELEAAGELFERYLYSNPD